MNQKKKLPTLFWVLIIAAGLLVIFLLAVSAFEFWKNFRSEKKLQLSSADYCHVLQDSEVELTDNQKIINWGSENRELILTTFNNNYFSDVSLYSKEDNHFDLYQNKKIQIRCYDNKECRDISSVIPISKKIYFAQMNIKLNDFSDSTGYIKGLNTGIFEYKYENSNEKIIQKKNIKICEQGLSENVVVNTETAKYQILDDLYIFDKEKSLFISYDNINIDPKENFKYQILQSSLLSVNCTESVAPRVAREAYISNSNFKTLLVWPQKTSQFPDELWVYEIQKKSMIGPKKITFPEFSEGYVNELSKQDDLYLASIYRVKSGDYINILFQENYKVTKVITKFTSKNSVRWAINKQDTIPVMYEIGKETSFYRLNESAGVFKVVKLFSIDNEFDFKVFDVYSITSKMSSVILLDRAEETKLGRKKLDKPTRRILNLTCDI